MDQDSFIANISLIFKRALYLPCHMKEFDLITHRFEGANDNDRKVDINKYVFGALMQFLNKQYKNHPESFRTEDLLLRRKNIVMAKTDALISLINTSEQSEWEELPEFYQGVLIELVERGIIDGDFGKTP